MGARSDNEPAQEPLVQPYLAEAFADVVGTSRFSVRALAPERTFWEKAMLLHEESFRPIGKERNARLARHYYDLFCLITRGIAGKAATNEQLFKRTATHREVYFNWTWMDYRTLTRGALRLVPSKDREKQWRRDYQAMVGEMFYGVVPPLDEVLSVIGGFVERFNSPQ